MHLMDLGEDSSDSDQELFPIVAHEYNHPNFQYEDPLTVSGVLKAVVEGSLEKVKSLLASGKSVNINDNNGNTPLHVAVIKNLQEILRFLLAREDISINIRNFCGETPLFHAVKQEHKNLVKLLVASGANVNLPNLEEVTPLHLAVKNPEIAHILIKNGANINTRDYSGDTALHEAVNENCLETVCMLLFYNADANVRCSNNITPFMKALISEHVEIQEALIEYVDDFNVATCDGMSILGLALTHTTPFVEEIIKRGADVNYIDPTLNSFSLCIDVPNTHKFRLIWNKIDKYQRLFSGHSYLRNLTLLDDSYFREYFEIILNSGNIIPVVESLFETNDLNIFIRNCCKCNVSLDLSTQFVCLLCSFGYVPTGPLLDEIYASFGFCGLFQFLLYMDINNIGEYILMSRIIYDVSLSIREFMEGVQNQVDSYLYNLVICKFILNPKVLSTLKLTPYVQYLEAISDLPDVPSLQDLSRNVFRDSVIKKYHFKKSSQYFSYLNGLDISVVYKNVLSYKTPLYNVRI